MNNIGEKIRNRRMELGMSQDELADKMGYKSRSTIAKIEKGVNDVVQSNIVKFAEVLNTSIAFLMGWEEDIEKNPVETAESFADLLVKISGESKDIIVMLEEYGQLSEQKKAQVKEYIHLLSGKG